MKKYWLDFSGSILIDAEDADDAEKKFWNLLGETMIQFVDLNGIEEKEEGV